MNSFSHFLNVHNLSVSSLFRHSQQLEGHTRITRAEQLRRKKLIHAGQKPAELPKLPSGRPVSARQLNDAVAGRALSAKVRQKVRRAAVNALGREVGFAELFGVAQEATK